MSLLQAQQENNTQNIAEIVNFINNSVERGNRAKELVP